MPDICIFYSEPDKEKVSALATIIESLGWSVWWAKDIKNGCWTNAIQTAIKNTNCVIPIWNSHAIRDGSMTFTEADFARQQGKPMITLVSEEKISPPFPFSSDQVTSDLSQWDGDSSSPCISNIVESLEENLGIAPSRWNGERPFIVNLRGKRVKLPCFVKSLSSHETQLDPEGGLFTFNLFPEVDALLVSAYDMYFEKQEHYELEKESHEYMCKQLEKLNERGAFILMDSGNYEKSRKKDESWSREKFNWTLENIPFTYAFCFDNLTPSADPEENAKEVIAGMEGKHEEVIIPILHAPLNVDGRRIHDLLPEIFFEYASRKNSPFIAVPERELGDGISKKVETVMNIREKLNTLGRYQPIHILGTGNPLSILILAAAGADFFDGLEWCRTVVDKNTGFLFHHQQVEFFINQTIENPRYPFVKELLEKDNEDVRLNLKMALHNLEFFMEWMEELQGSIKSDTIREMIKDRAVFGTHTFLDELKKLMPGLFK